MSDDPLATTLTVEIGSDAAKDKFEFTIPTLHQEIAIGTRMAKLRREIDPSWDQFSQGLDYGTSVALRAAATFELLLAKASVAWPFTTDPGTKKLVVDSSKFPANKAVDVVTAYETFQEALGRFRQGGDSDSKPTGEIALDGQQSS